jgi:hypothetical protein
MKDSKYPFIFKIRTFPTQVLLSEDTLLLFRREANKQMDDYV